MSLNRLSPSSPLPPNDLFLLPEKACSPSRHWGCQANLHLRYLGTRVAKKERIFLDGNVNKFVSVFLLLDRSVNNHPPSSRQWHRRAVIWGGKWIVVFMELILPSDRYSSPSSTWFPVVYKSRAWQFVPAKPSAPSVGLASANSRFTHLFFRWMLLPLELFLPLLPNLGKSRQ